MSDKLITTLDAILENEDAVHIIFTETQLEFRVLVKLLSKFRRLRVLTSEQSPDDVKAGLLDIQKGCADTLLTTKQNCTGWTIYTDRPVFVHYLWEEFNDNAPYSNQALSRIKRVLSRKGN